MSTEFFVPGIPTKQTEPTGPRDLRSILDAATYDECLSLHISLHNSYTRIGRHIPRWHRAKERKSMLKTIPTKYLVAIYAIREQADRETLLAVRGRLIDRMNAGWNMPATDKRNDLFERLLAEYELVEDALADSAMDRWMDRVERSFELWPESL